MEIVIQIRLDGNALSGTQPYLRSRGNRVLPPVTVYPHIRVSQPLLPAGIIYAYEHIASSPVDDILHLIPVEMHGRRLSFLHVQQLFRIGLCVLIHGHIAVSQGDEGESHLVKIPHSKIRDIPSQHVVPDLIVFMALFVPFFRCKITERGQFKGASVNHLFHVPQCPVDF